MDPKDSQDPMGPPAPWIPSHDSCFMILCASELAEPQAISLMGRNSLSVLEVKTLTGSMWSI